MIRKWLFLVCVALLVMACAEEEEAEAPSSEREPVPETETSDQAPSVMPTPAEPVTQTDADEAGESSATAAMGSCRRLRERPTVLFPNAGPLAAHGVGSAAIVVGYTKQGESEEVVVARMRRGGASRVLARAPLEGTPSQPRVAPPAIAVAGDHVHIAAVAAAGNLQYAHFNLDSPPATLTWNQVAAGLDLRFRPALWVSSSQRILAWTTSTTPMQVGYSANPEAATPTLRRVTPDGGGAAQPRFFSDRGGVPSLAFVDPRTGLSVLHRASFSRSGSLGEVEVIRPLMSLSGHPQFEISPHGDALWVAYAAVGSMATSAVGLIDHGPQAQLRPLLRGSGYGRVWVNQAVTPDGVLYAILAPTGTSPTAPREVQLRALQGSRLGQTQVIVPEARRPTHIALAHVENQDFILAFTSAQRARGLMIRCRP